MTETAKPLWWRIVTPGNPPGDWHEETLMWGMPPEPMPSEEVDLLFGPSGYLLRSLCCPSHSVTAKRATDPDIETCRTAPPVADQCAKCRAAKAKQRKEKGK